MGGIVLWCPDGDPRAQLRKAFPKTSSKNKNEASRYFVSPCLHSWGSQASQIMEGGDVVPGTFYNFYNSLLKI